MALPAIDISDFTGFIKIVTNGLNKTDKLQSYIDRFYKFYLRRLIGDEAYLNALNNDFDKWNDLLNGDIEYKDVDNNLRLFDGFVSEIRKLIYCEYIRDHFSSTVVGQVKNDSENALTMSGAEITENVITRWNSAIRTLDDQVMSFLKAFEERKEDVTGFVDNLDNTYTIEIPSTKYLLVGDIVTIDGNQYIVQSIVIDVSFNIDAGVTGLSFAGPVTWGPYKLVVFQNEEFMTI